MARISTYVKDDEVNPNDIVIGSEHSIDNAGRVTYKTKNYRMIELQTFFQGSNFTANAPINLTGTTNKVWSHDNITVSTPSASSLLTHNGGTNGQFTVVTGVTTDSYTEDSLIVTKGHVKQINTTTYTLPDYKFNIAADSNPGSDDAVIDINSSSFDTLNVLGGAVLTSKITADDTITIDHNEYTAKSITTDAVDVLHTFVSDAYGHVTTITKRTLPTFGGADTSENIAGSVGVVPAPDVNDELKFLRGDADWATPPGTYSFDINADNDSNPVSNKEITSGQTLNILGATPISTAVLAADTVTISATDFTGPTTNPDVSGVRGLVPAPTTDDGSKFLKGNGGWAVPTDTQYSVMGSGDPASYDAGLVLAGSATHNNNFLRKDGSWATVTQTDISSTAGTFVSITSNSGATGSVTVNPDLSASGLGSTTAAKQLQFLRGDNTWSNVNNATLENIGGLRLFNNTHPANTINTATTVNGRFYGLQTSGASIGLVNVPWTDTNTWNANTKTVAGYVSAPGNDANKVWKTDASGNPAWREDANDNDNTQNTTTLSFVDSSNDIILRNTTGGAGSGNQDIKFVAGSNIALTHTDVNNITIASTDANTFRAVTAGGNTLGASETLAFTAGSNVTITESAGAVTIASTDTNTNTTYSAGAGIDLSGTTFSLTQTTLTGNGFFKIPFMSSNVINVDSSASSFSYNPSSNVLAVNKISIGTTSTLTGRSIYSQSTGSNYFEIANTSTSNGGRLLFGCTTSGFNGIYSRNHNNTAGREFRLIQLSNTVVTVATSGNTTVNGTVTATNFIVGSDRRIKSEIEPIKEGLEVIKQFTSYNYIKGGEKESGFIAQEVREAIPHTVYENNEGYLSMSDRGVLAHMHKAILELEERLTAIEEKLN